MKTTSISGILILLLATCIVTASEKRSEVILDDATQFGPSSAISREASETAWHLVEAADSPTGWRLETTIKTTAPDIEIPLDVKGIYAIYIGVFMPDTLTSGVLARIDDDPQFAFIRGRCDGKYPAYHETLYKVADCTGRKLVFRQPAEYRSYITHIRLEPRETLAKLPPATKEVIGLADTWHYFYFFSPRESDCIGTMLKMHELCGMTEISFEVGRSCMTYESKVSTIYHYDKHRPRTKWLNHHATHNRPWGEAVEVSEALDLPMTARLCMNMHYRGAYQGTATGEFALKHPEYQERNRDGKPKPDQLCFGYKPVRDERVAIFRELVTSGAKAISLDCMLYMPMANWGTPYVEGFQKDYGIDPRTLDEKSPQWETWLKYRASYFTLLLCEIDAMLKEVGRPDTKVYLRVNDEGLASTLENGVDIRQIVAEGLADRILLGANFPAHRIKSDVIREYRELLDGTSIKLIAGLRAHGYPAMPGPEHHTKGNWPTAMYFCPDVAQRARNVAKMYELGVDGVAFYESDEGCFYPGMRDFFIACRSPETIQAFVEKTKTAEEKALEDYHFNHTQTPSITSTVGPIKGENKYRIEHAIDGDFSTRYIAGVKCCKPNAEGCAVTLAFDEPTQIDRLAMLFRAEPNRSWMPRSMKVEHEKDGQWIAIPITPDADHATGIWKTRFTPITTSKLRVLMNDVTAGANNPEIIEMTWH